MGETKIPGERVAIILLGLPGAGKGTQADLLADHFGLVHIETSRLIRRKFAEVSGDDPEIREAKRLYDLGHLVTTELVARWLIEEVTDLHTQGLGIVFDGSPRTRYEAEALFPILERLYTSRSMHVILVEIGEAKAAERIARRRICDTCYKPIPDTSKNRRRKYCPRDECKGILFTRDLDQPHIVRERMRVFQKDTSPVIDFFDGRNILRRVNGEGPIKDIFDNILTIVSS